MQKSDLRFMINRAMMQLGPHVVFNTLSDVIGEYQLRIGRASDDSQFVNNHLDGFKTVLDHIADELTPQYTNQKDVDDAQLQEPSIGQEAPAEISRSDLDQVGVDKQGADNPENNVGGKEQADGDFQGNGEEEHNPQPEEQQS